MGLFSSIGHLGHEITHALTHVATDPLRALGSKGNALADKLDRSLDKVQGKAESAGKAVAPIVLGAVGAYFGGPAGAALGTAIGDEIQGKTLKQSLIGGAEAYIGGELAGSLSGVGSTASDIGGESISVPADVDTEVVGIGGAAGSGTDIGPLSSVLAGSSSFGQYATQTAEAVGKQFAGSFEQSFAGEQQSNSTYGSIGSYLDHAFTQTDNDFAQIGGAIIGTIKGMFSNGFSGFLQSVGALSSEMVKGVDAISAEIGDFLKPITSLVDDVDNVVEAIQDKLIEPVTNIITTTETESRDLLKGLSTDLHSGLSGLVKIPETIASALTTEGAALQRANETLATDQESIVNDSLVPGLGRVLGTHLQAIAGAFQPKVATHFTGAEAKYNFPIEDEEAINNIIRSANELTQHLQAPDSIMGPLVGWLLSASEGVSAAVGIVRAQHELGRQSGMASNPVAILGPAEAIRARYRGTITEEAYIAEMLRHGISLDRAETLYVNAQYLFDPARATDMFWRELIPHDEWMGILQQNGMEPHQADAYLESTRSVFLPIELVRMLARGIIDETTFRRGMTSRHYNADQEQALQELVTELPGLKSTIDADRRRLAANIGILHDFLSVPVPDDIAELGNARMIAPEQVANDWINHWDLPNAADWIKAWWRDIVSKGDMEMGFQALGIPSGLWDALPELERQVIPFWGLYLVADNPEVTHDDIMRWMKWQGFNDRDSQLLADGLLKKDDTTRASAANTLKGLTATTAKDLFEQQAIDQDTYRDLLVQLGYGEEGAQLTVELETLKFAQQARTDMVNNLVDQAKLGLLDVSKVQQELYNAGFSTPEIESAILKIQNAIKTTVKMPSVAQLNDMLRKQVISSDLWLSTMMQFGYPKEWAERIALTL